MTAVRISIGLPTAVALATDDPNAVDRGGTTARSCRIEQQASNSDIKSRPSAAVIGPRVITAESAVAAAADVRRRVFVNCKPEAGNDAQQNYTAAAAAMTTTIRQSSRDGGV